MCPFKLVYSDCGPNLECRNLLKCVFVLIAFISHRSVINCQFQEKQEDAKFHVPIGTLQHAQKYSLKNGGTLMNGQLVASNDKLLQRVTAGGTSYYLLENSNGKPLYRRKEIDTNRHVILFPDPTYPPGDGHYVVLRKILTRKNISPLREQMYQGFYLVLGDSLHAFMSIWKQPHQKKHNENPMEKKMDELHRKQKQMERQQTYNVEFSDVDFSDMVKRIRRQDDFGLNKNRSEEEAPI